MQPSPPNLPAWHRIPLCCRPGQRGKRDEVQVNEKAKHKRGERLVAFQFKGSWQEGEKMAEGNRGG